MSDKPIMLNNPEEVELDSKSKEAADLIVRQMNNKKMQIIKAKLKEIGKLNLMKDLYIKRFPPIKIEIGEKEEVVYINNGTIKGKRLVTFVRHTESELKDNEFRSKLIYY